MKSLMTHLSFLQFLLPSNPTAQELQEKLVKEKKHVFSEFVRFFELYLSHDHPIESLNSHITRFVEKYIQTGYFTKEDLVGFHFTYSYFYNDTWEAHGITQRFVKTFRLKSENGSVLHLAALTGNLYFIQTLLDLGFDKNSMDAANKKPADYLTSNSNYVSQEQHIKLMNLLS